MTDFFMGWSFDLGQFFLRDRVALLKNKHRFVAAHELSDERFPL
jgi:hypothetical protein